MAPVAPKVMPNILRLVMTSAAKKAPIMSTKIGLVTIITAALIGGGEVEPFKKQHLIDGHTTE